MGLRHCIKHFLKRKKNEKDENINKLIGLKHCIKKIQLQKHTHARACTHTHTHTHIHTHTHRVAT